MHVRNRVLFVYGPCADDRYVVEVETVPDKREYKAEKLVNGNVRLEPQGPRKTVKYYEILSRTPLTAKQCQDSIRLGKARQVSRSVRKSAPEERDAGRLGRCQSGGCRTYRV